MKYLVQKMTEIFLKSWFYLIFPANEKFREPLLKKFGKKLDPNILAFEPFSDLF